MSILTGWISLAVAAAVGGFAPQQPVPSQVVVVGCINRVTHNGSVGGIAGAVPATPGNAATLANTQEPTGAFILNGATVDEMNGRAAADTEAPGRTLHAYVLEGRAADVQKHVGHRVEIKGRLLPPKADGAPAATKSNVKRLEVASLRMIAAACSTPPTPTP